MGTKYKAGRYRARITDQGFGESSKKQTPFFFLKIMPFGIYDPSSPADPEPVESYERTVERYITDGTITFFIEDLKALGYSRTKFSELDPANDGYHSFADQEVDVICAHETNDSGDTFEKWSLAKASGRQIERIDAKSVSKLDALYGQKLKAAIKTNGNAASKPAKPSKVAAEVGDEVPF